MMHAKISSVVFGVQARIFMVLNIPLKKGFKYPLKKREGAAGIKVSVLL
jgi:hypothetical protein